MMKRTTSLSVSATAIAAATQGFAQSVDSTAWDLLEAIEVEEIVTETSYEVRKIFPSEIKDGVEQFDITGYAVPLGSGTNVSELMLVSDMGFCPFCGDPDHGTALQVSLAEPLPILEEGTRLQLRGSLETITDSATWQSAVMRNARLVEG